MELYVGLDASLKETSICVVDKDGKTVRETKVVTDPEAIRCALRGFARGNEETGSEWK